MLNFWQQWELTLSSPVLPSLVEATDEKRD